MTNSSYNWSPPAERNQDPILERLRQLLPGNRTWRVLEIGSGTGQHAVHFTQALPHIEWLTSDLVGNHVSINAYLDEAGNAQIKRPLELDAQRLGKFNEVVDVIYTANTCHIMSWDNVVAMLTNAGSVLAAGGRLIIYGPFHVGGQPTSDGNHRFDQTLSQSNPAQGIRDREHVVWQADTAGISMTQWFSMPANNQLLVFERRRKNCRGR